MKCFCMNPACRAVETVQEVCFEAVQQRTAGLMQSTVASPATQITGDDVRHKPDVLLLIREGLAASYCFLAGMVCGSGQRNELKVDRVVEGCVLH